MKGLPLRQCGGGDMIDWWPKRISMEWSQWTNFQHFLPLSPALYGPLLEINRRCKALPKTNWRCAPCSRPAGAAQPYRSPNGAAQPYSSPPGAAHPYRRPADAVYPHRSSNGAAHPYRRSTGVGTPSGGQRLISKNFFFLMRFIKTCIVKFKETGI